MSLSWLRKSYRRKLILHKEENPHSAVPKNIYRKFSGGKKVVENVAQAKAIPA